MTLKYAIISNLWTNFLSFTGRESRREYWYFTGFAVLATLFIQLSLGTWSNNALLLELMGGTYRFYLLRTVGTCLCLALFLASVAVGLRRGHDFGKADSPPENAARPVTLLFALPDLENLPGRFEDQRMSALQVTLLPDIRHYASRQDWGAKPSFMDAFDKLSRFECQTDGTVAPGIARLREPTSEEAVNILEQYTARGPRFEKRSGCLGKAAVSGAAYAIRTDAGEPLGFGRCVRYGPAATAGSCLFTFWLPQMRFVEYRFSEAFLPDVRRMHSSVQSLLADATVRAASRNIPNL